MIGSYAFANCSVLTSVEFSNSVTVIRNGAFSYCPALATVTIPDNVEDIGSNAFEGCTGLTSVTIGSSVSYIGYTAFSVCTSLQQIIVDPDNAEFASDEQGALYSKDFTTLIVCPGGKTEFDIPETVTTIDDMSFWGCVGLTSITIPGSVTTIGGAAFYECKSISTVKFDDGETDLSLGVNAFQGVNLKEAYFGRQMNFGVVSGADPESVEFGENVLSIEDGAFSSAISLRSVTAHSTVPPTIGEDTFADETYNEGTLYVDNDAINAYKAAAGWKNFLAISALDGTESGVSEIANDSDSLLSVEKGAICVSGDKDVRVVSMTGTTIYSGRGETRINVTPGVYIVIAGNTATKVAVQY
jgi:hypothetical protein